jgi:hypothetical protein
LKVRNVPQGVGEQSQEQPFAVLVLDAKAVAQITGSFSLTWPALAQRKRFLANDCFLDDQPQNWYCPVPTTAHQKYIHPAKV